MTARRLFTRARGYTIVELLMSLSVLAIGVSGIIAMQRVTLATSRHAKDLAVATRIAEAWADQLTADGMVWTSDTAGISTRLNTTWLKTATDGNTGTWVLPTYSTALGFGPAFGPLGQPRDPANQPQLAHFCAHIRLAFVQPETAPAAGNGPAGNGVIRAQVRVVWLRDDQSATPPAGDICAITPTTFANNLESFHIVYVTTSIRQLPTGRSAGP
jgi:prepilin-type N-terminal cleavage/methylation domain-containing protein